MAEEEDVKPNNPNRLRTSKNVTLAVKLNGMNYPLWARLMKVAIGSRGAYRHITGVPPPPKPEDRGYLEWEETDLIVFSWIIDNIETDIVVDFAHHQTAKAVWESLAVTFESTSDPYMIYDLEDKANRMVQGELNTEMYWRHLHGIWIDIDRLLRQMGGTVPEAHSHEEAFQISDRIEREVRWNPEGYPQGESVALSRGRIRLGKTGSHTTEDHAAGEPRPPSRRNQRGFLIGRNRLGIWSQKSAPHQAQSLQRSGQPPPRSTASCRRG